MSFIDTAVSPLPTAAYISPLQQSCQQHHLTKVSGDNHTTPPAAGCKAPIRQLDANAQLHLSNTQCNIALVHFGYKPPSSLSKQPPKPDTAGVHSFNYSALGQTLHSPPCTSPLSPSAFTFPSFPHWHRPPKSLPAPSACVCPCVSICLTLSPVRVCTGCSQWSHCA